MNDQSTPEIDDSKAPLIEHLIELRQRLLWSVAALVVASGSACFLPMKFSRY